MTFRRFLLVLAVITGLAGCIPNPNYSPPAIPAPRSNGPDDWWWSVNPCTLMTASELRRLGLPTGPTQSQMDWVPNFETTPESYCDWNPGTGSLAIALAAVPYSTVAGATVNKAEESAFRTADGRPGRMFADSDDAGACDVTIQATKGSSADVGVVPSPGIQACQVAVKVANLIAPELPSSKQG